MTEPRRNTPPSKYWPPHPSDYGQHEADERGIDPVAAKRLDDDHMPTGEWVGQQEPDNCTTCGGGTCYYGRHFGHIPAVEAHDIFNDRRPK